MGVYMAGRPREFDRNEALAKARDVFWEHGYEGTSMTALTGALGLASARIYAAFGSKEALFREAIALYEATDGGFASRALAEESNTREAFERMLTEAVGLYTRPGRALGCMVVSAATNCTIENDPVRGWLAEHRRARTVSIIERLREALGRGELRPETEVGALGDYFATLLHGLSVQARDGVSRQRLLGSCLLAMQILDAHLLPPA